MAETAETPLVTPPQPDAHPAAESYITKAGLERFFSNPYPVRFTLSEEEEKTVVGLMDTLPTHGLLQAITAREMPDGTYQVISGHLRLEAFRRLRDRAQTDEERARFSTIPVEVKTGVDDRKMALIPILENVHRAELMPVSLARALVAFKQMANLTTEQLAKEVGLEKQRVYRLERLDAAEDFIKQACVGSGRGKGKRKGLDLYAALEFQRAYSYLAKHDRPKRARARVEALIQKAIAEEWSFTKIEEQVHRITGSKRQADEEAGPGEGAPEGAGIAEARDASPGGNSPDAAADDADPAHAPIAAPADVSPARASLEEAPQRATDLLGSPPPNPALEYVGGDVDEILIHLRRAAELTNPQRQDMRQLIGLLTVIFSDS